MSAFNLDQGVLPKAAAASCETTPHIYWARHLLRLQRRHNTHLAPTQPEVRVVVVVGAFGG